MDTRHFLPEEGNSIQKPFPCVQPTKCYGNWVQDTRCKGKLQVSKEQIFHEKCHSGPKPPINFCGEDALLYTHEDSHHIMERFPSVFGVEKNGKYYPKGLELSSSKTPCTIFIHKKN